MSTRVVHHADALEWLALPRALAGASVITSLPDRKELPELGLDAWRTWFARAAEQVLSGVADDALALFFQSDVRVEGEWIDKSAIVQAAAARAGSTLVYHGIVCRRPPGTVTFGRASYSHLLAFSKRLRPAVRRAIPDVLPDGGLQVGPKAMGARACALACRYILAETATRLVVDPFCGFGTVLAVANALGLDAIGVDKSSRMVRKARALQIDPQELA